MSVRPGRRPCRRQTHPPLRPWLADAFSTLYDALLLCAQLLNVTTSTPVPRSCHCAGSQPGHQAGGVRCLADRGARVVVTQISHGDEGHHRPCAPARCRRGLRRISSRWKDLRRPSRACCVIPFHGPAAARRPPGCVASIQPLLRQEACLEYHEGNKGSVPGVRTVTRSLCRAQRP